MKPRVFITGASGQLGQAVVKVFGSGFDLLATDIHPQSTMTGVRYRRLDITDQAAVNTLIKEEAPDCILHLAAMTDVDGCEKKPDLAKTINVDSTSNLLKAAESGAFCVFISTDYVFDGRQGPYRETDMVNPINIYGQTKLDSEKIITASSGDWSIIRTNVVFDYTANSAASFVKWVVDSLTTGQSIRVVTDQWNNPTWTVSLARVLKTVIENRTTGLLHYGGATWLNRFEFALLIARVFQLDPRLITPITTAELKQPAPRPLIGGLKTKFIQEKLSVSCDPLDSCLMEIRNRLKS